MAKPDHIASIAGILLRKTRTEREPGSRVTQISCVESQIRSDCSWSCRRARRVVPRGQNETIDCLEMAAMESMCRSNRVNSGHSTRRHRAFPRLFAWSEPGGLRRAMPHNRPASAIRSGRARSPVEKRTYARFAVMRQTISIASMFDSAVEVDAELFQLFGVVALVEQIPLLGAFGDFALLRADLGARRAVDFLFGLQQSVITFTSSSRTSLGSRFSRNSRLLRSAATILWEMSLILSRESFMWSPESRPEARITLRCVIRVFLMRRNIS